MTFEQFQQDEADLDRALDHREELDREDIIDGAITGWLRAVTPRRPAQPVVALLESIPEAWEEVA